MPQRERSIVNSTILERIGVSQKVVNSWHRAGLKISYPMRKLQHFYLSEDGEAFVENGDKYLIPFSKRETSLYTNHPEVFIKDFLKNVRLYVRFMNWIHGLQPKAVLLETKEKFTSLLVLLYLFQRAMDYHYYHFDRYLAYQNYPDTPVGFWWDRLKNLSQRLSHIMHQDENIVFLNLLGRDKKTMVQCKNFLSRKNVVDLLKILKNIKFFEDAQEKEVKAIVDTKTQENVLFRTAVPIWSALMDMLKAYPELIKPKFRVRLPSIREGNPLIMTRVILSPEGLNYFQSSIAGLFTKEVMRWV